MKTITLPPALRTAIATQKGEVAKVSVATLVTFKPSTKKELARLREGNYPDRAELFLHVCRHLGYKVEPRWGHDCLNVLVTWQPTLDEVA